MSEEIKDAEFAITKSNQDVRGLAALGQVEEVKRNLELSTARVEAIHEFIAERFVEGTDFGPADDRNQKNVLLKPGAEKICKVANTSFIFEKDTDTYEMLGSPKGTVCYVCKIIDNNTGAVVGEGRGAAEVGDKKRDVNKTIKNAEKCALVDAALYTFSLSSAFTQDISPKKKTFDKEKAELWELIQEARIGISSSMSNSEFSKCVTADFCNGPANTVGAIRALKKAIIDDGIYDLSTGERIPQ